MTAIATDFDLITEKDLFGVTIDKKYKFPEYMIKDNTYLHIKEGYSYLKSLIDNYRPNVEGNISLLSAFQLL